MPETSRSSSRSGATRRCSTPPSRACAPDRRGLDAPRRRRLLPRPHGRRALRPGGRPRIRYLRNETNLGITENYARCRDLASGELMMFLGCDDLMDPGFVATVRARTRVPRSGDHPGRRPRHRRGRRTSTPGRQGQAGGQTPRPRSDRAGRRAARGQPAARQLALLARAGLPHRPGAGLRVPRRPADHPGSRAGHRHGRGRRDLGPRPEVCFSYRRHPSSASATSLLHGRRLPDERRYYAEAAEQMRARGWRRAARTARLRWTSRLHAVALLPQAVRARAGLGTW